MSALYEVEQITISFDPNSPMYQLKAIPVGIERFRITDIPLFIDDVALNDIISVEALRHGAGDLMVADKFEVIERGGHSTIVATLTEDWFKACYSNKTAMTSFISAIQELGCDCQGVRSSVVIDLPEDSNIAGTLQWLEEQKSAGRIRGYRFSYVYSPPRHLLH